MSGGARVFSTSGFMIRLLFALFIVFATYNPTRYSYIHLLQDPQLNLGFKLVIGLILFTLNVFLLVTALDSLRPLGMVLVVLDCFGVAYWLHSIGMIDLWRGETLVLCLLATLATLNAAGLSFSLWSGRLSGLTHIAQH
jgi:Family of unknown function (DUF6524)